MAVFTGSAATGRKVMASAAPTLKHLTLELGSNNAGIVLPDGHRRSHRAMFRGAFINSGQTCAALNACRARLALRSCSAFIDVAARHP
jgi:acyl-CoA reductase-like NAD-dependent aldehyde dehydrogenase